MSRCVDCSEPGPSICSRCKAERRRLRALHVQHDNRCEADRDAKAERMAVYIAAKERGEPLFETEPA